MLGRSSDFSGKLLRWYDVAHRDLPWRVRGVHPAPYHVLVSEFMLQQTQVATVIPYFQRFLCSYPTLAALAAADEQEVLRHWQGLGYYTRARNLLRCAREVASKHNGELPADTGVLQTLPGVGRYTAGAIGSIAFGRRVPILDANVTRVICRLDRIETDPKDRSVQEQLWQRAQEMLPRKRAGDFNSALMELGALICSPRSPQCLICPVRTFCQAHAAGIADRIPMQRKKAKSPLLQRQTFCVRSGNRWLIEQRPPTGRWAGMWQFITRPADDPQALPVKTSTPLPMGSVTHSLTHRRYEFAVFRCDAMQKTSRALSASVKWVTLTELERFPLPRPHVLITKMLQSPAANTLRGKDSDRENR